jgi:hypothetical protein
LFNRSARIATFSGLIDDFGFFCVFVEHEDDAPGPLKNFALRLNALKYIISAVTFFFDLIIKNHKDFSRNCSSSTNVKKLGIKIGFFFCTE